MISSTIPHQQLIAMFNLSSDQVHNVRNIVVKTDSGDKNAIFIEGIHRNLLEALEDNGINHPNTCRTGVCGDCKIHVKSGDSRGLKDQETNSVYACKCKPTSDMILSNVLN
jgi:ferredoxin